MNPTNNNSNNPWVVTPTPQTRKPFSPEAQVRRAEIARINGTKSEGPTSEEGRAKSSRNALKHGLSATVHTVLNYESQDGYTAFQHAWVMNLRPADAVELHLVHLISNSQWRIQRLVLMETALLNLQFCHNFEDIIKQYAHIDDVGALAAAWKASSGSGNGLDLLRRYMGTIQSQFSNSFKAFEKLESRRRDHNRVREIGDYTPPVIPNEPVTSSQTIETTFDPSEAPVEQSE